MDEEWVLKQVNNHTGWFKPVGGVIGSLWVVKEKNGDYSIGTLHSHQSTTRYPTLEAAMLAAEVLYG